MEEKISFVLSFFSPFGRDATKRQRGFYNRSRVPETILNIKGQKATIKIMPDPIQSTIVSCLRVSVYFR
jgi:hypothetical protein